MRSREGDTCCGGPQVTLHPTLIVNVTEECSDCHRSIYGNRLPVAVTEQSITADSFVAERTQIGHVSFDSMTSVNWNTGFISSRNSSGRRQRGEGGSVRRKKYVEYDIGRRGGFSDPGGDIEEIASLP
jgi:hypothetical protein